MIRVESLATIPMFRGLPDQAVAELDRACIWRSVDPGAWVLDYKAAGQELYFVPRGHLRVVVPAAGRDIILRDLRDGDFFGELAAIDGRERSAGIMAVTSSIVARLAAPRFMDLLHQHAEVCDYLLRHLAGQVRLLANKINEQSTMNVRERLLAELMRLSTGGVSSMPVVSPPPTHAELGARIGSNREAVTRELNIMTRQGLIERRRGAIVLVKSDYIRALLDACAEL